MSDHSGSHTAFLGHRLLAAGDLREVAVAVHRAMAADADASVLVFSDRTGHQVDLDLRGTEAAVAKRYTQAPTDPAPAEPPSRARGRPRMGVVAREVTLLPEHWEWLAAQPGGISVTLRKLVHQARRSAAAQEGVAAARQRAYAFMSALAGNLRGFEEATRALFAGDQEKLAGVIARWPRDVRTHVMRLSVPGQAEAPAQFAAKQ
jgi:hypothetical protein